MLLEVHFVDCPYDSRLASYYAPRYANGHLALLYTTSQGPFLETVFPHFLIL